MAPSAKPQNLASYCNRQDLRYLAPPKDRDLNRSSAPELQNLPFVSQLMRTGHLPTLLRPSLVGLVFRPSSVRNSHAVLRRCFLVTLTRQGHHAASASIL